MHRRFLSVKTDSLPRQARDEDTRICFDQKVCVFIAGEPLAWTGAGTLDRTFYTFGDENSGFSAGEHTIEFTMGTVSTQHLHTLSSTRSGLTWYSLV